MKYVAIYLRLSIEDRRCIENGLEKGESSSIRNQRKQIYEYIHRDSELSRYEVVEFCDDGYSGTNMQRPGMQKLLKEIKSNKIWCIIVKDMSRFSRDYIEMGNYLNQIFPFMGIRFIAINDHYDSRKYQGCPIELDTAFRTLLYDLYSKDVSVKVKTSFENKCENGEYVFGQVPFGYEKSKEVKNAVVINEKEASVVRYIFSLAMQGKSSTQIARELYEEGVPTIMQMRKLKRQDTDGKIHSWSPASIRKILNNRFYLGEMAYGKTVRKTVGSKNGISVPREDWKVIQGHHEALISEEIFMQTASFKDCSVKRKRKKHPLTGKLYCGGCGYAMSYKPICGKNRYRRFECKKHALFQIPECCTYMRADVLEETVLFMLNLELMIRGNAIQQNLASFQNARIQSLKKKERAYKVSIKKAKAGKNALYEKYALGSLTGEAYTKQTDELTKQITSLSVKAEEAAFQLAQLEHAYPKMEEDVKQRIGYLHIEELTQDVVDIFIKKVYAYKDKKVEIEWNFVSLSVERELS